MSISKKKEAKKKSSLLGNYDSYLIEFNGSDLDLGKYVEALENIGKLYLENEDSYVSILNHLKMIVIDLSKDDDSYWMVNEMIDIIYGYYPLRGMVTEENSVVTIDYNHQKRIDEFILEESESVLDFKDFKSKKEINDNFIIYPDGFKISVHGSSSYSFKHSYNGMIIECGKLSKLEQALYKNYVEEKTNNKPDKVVIIQD